MKSRVKLPKKKASFRKNFSRAKQGNFEWLRIKQQLITDYQVITINPRDSDRFVLEQKLYQQYKIMKIRVEAVPIMSEGNSPRVSYMKFVVNGEVPNANSIIQTGSMLNPNRTTVKFFRLGGRQNDFNYWFDTTATDLPTIKLYVKPQDGTDTRYNLTISIQLKFRQRIVPSTDTVSMIKEADQLNEAEKIDEEIEKLTKKLKELKEYKKFKEN